jgi:hypothetical protein
MGRTACGMALDKPSHWFNKKYNIKEINGWYWRDVVIFNETLNNDVTVYWGYSKPHRVLG